MMVWEIFGQFGLVWFGYYTNLLISCDICSQSKKFKLIMTQQAKGYHLWWFGKKKNSVWFGLAILWSCLYLVIYAANMKNSNWLWFRGPRSIICDGLEICFWGLVWFGDFTFCLYLVIYSANPKNSNWLWFRGPRAIICDGLEKNGLVWFGYCKI